MTNLLTCSQLHAQAEQLLGSMSLQQKVGQMVQADRLTCSPDNVKDFHIGSILSSAGSCPEGNTQQDWLNMTDAYWQASTTSSTAIPILYAVDAIHGHSNVVGATVFPHNIGLGAANNLELVQQIAQATAIEMMATGVDWNLAPNVAVAQDMRWGRTYESYHQDPRKVSEFAHTMVKNLQANQQGESILACVKHWVGDGATEYGLDQGNSLTCMSGLKETHIPPFLAAIEAGAMSIMVSFSSWQGNKCHGHHNLITQTLKGDIGFNGLVLSDMQGIDALSDDFYVAVGHGVNAGIDMFMLTHNWPLFIEYLISHAELGSVSMHRINDAVLRILKVKLACGLLDKPKPSERVWPNTVNIGCNEHQKIAQKAVQASSVLLKNSPNVLPLDQGKKIVVTGKSAHNIGHQCGGFTLSWQGVTDNESFPHGQSIWQGIHNICPHASLVQSDEELTASDADIAIIVIGEKPYAEGKGDIRRGSDSLLLSGSNINGHIQLQTAYGHSLTLSELHPEDLATIRTAKDKGMQIVTILISGRPLVVDEELALSECFITAWLFGNQGNAIAPLLFEPHAFTGSLPFTWPIQTSSTIALTPEKSLF